MTDTIYALATAPGRAAVAVVRLSGPETAKALQALAPGRLSPRRASLRRLQGPDGSLLDEALVIWMPGPASYTGEDSAELHLHGGPAVVEAVSAALDAYGLRPAEAGAFTRRAFENGKLDLTQAEAVADLVEAETRAQRDQALRQLDGALAARYEAWRSALIVILAHLEAAVDFPDEDLPEALADRIRPDLDELISGLEGALADDGRGEQVRDGFRVALIGAPNAGKSSLLNRLARREAAIVTASPGTTRDVIEAPLVLAGYKVILADMAGVRETLEPIEAEGVRRARDWAAGADLRLWLVDGSAAEGAWREAEGLAGAEDLCLLTKADLTTGPDGVAARAWADQKGLKVLSLSVSTGAGLEGLERLLTERIAGRLTGRDFPAVTRVRHRLRLNEALDHTRRARSALSAGAELAAEDLRLAGRALARVAGRVDTEEILGQVFASFCIGK